MATTRPKTSRGTYLSHAYDIDRVRITMFYPWPAIIKSFGISRTTLQRWRESGRLICHSKNSTLVRGDFLLAAMKNETNGLGAANGKKD